MAFRPVLNFPYSVISAGRGHQAWRIYSPRRQIRLAWPRRLAGLGAALLLAGTALPAQRLGSRCRRCRASPGRIIRSWSSARATFPASNRNATSMRRRSPVTMPAPSTICLAEVRSELGADRSPPLIIVNGERVSSLDDIGAFPVEAVENVKVLPNGSAIGVGGNSSQRVISLTLKKKVRAAILLAAHTVATDGDWNADRGEAILTYIEGPKRVNVAFESAMRTTCSRTSATSSSRMRRPISVRFRTLRPDSRTYDLSGTFATRLAPWLTVNARLRFAHATGRSARGLPSTLFVLPSTHPDSPFATDVEFELFGPDALHSRTLRDSGEGSVDAERHLRALDLAIQRPPLRWRRTNADATLEPGRHRRHPRQCRSVQRRSCSRWPRSKPTRRLSRTTTSSAFLSFTDRRSSSPPATCWRPSRDASSIAACAPQRISPASRKRRATTARWGRSAARSMCRLPASTMTSWRALAT